MQEKYMFAKTTLCQVFKNLSKTSISVIITFFFKGKPSKPTAFTEIDWAPTLLMEKKPKGNRKLHIFLCY